MNGYSFRSFFRYTLPLIAYLVFIFFLSSQPKTGPEIPVRHIDKVIHFFIYLPLPWFFFSFLRQSPYIFIKYNFLIHGIILSLLYAASDEWHQSFVPTRSMDFYDWLADSAGILAGTFLYRIYLRWRQERG